MATSPTHRSNGPYPPHVVPVVVDPHPTPVVPMICCLLHAIASAVCFLVIVLRFQNLQCSHVVVCFRDRLHFLRTSLGLAWFALTMPEVFHSLSLSLYPPMPRPQGFKKLHSPMGHLRFRARMTFLAVRWLEKQTYSNEAAVLLAPETQL